MCNNWYYDLTEDYRLAGACPACAERSRGEQSRRKELVLGQPPVDDHQPLRPVAGHDEGALRMRAHWPLDPPLARRNPHRPLHRPKDPLGAGAVGHDGRGEVYPQAVVAGLVLHLGADVDAPRPRPARARLLGPA